MLQNPIESDTESPLFIWAPFPGSGEASLQRLVASTGDVLVYGGNPFLTTDLPISLRDTQRLGPDSDKARARLASGDYNFWSSSVSPDNQSYEKVLLEGFDTILNCYRISSEREGYQRWGLVVSAPNATSIGVLQQLLPEAYHVVIYRSPFDVVGSMLTPEQQTNLSLIRRFTELWALNMRTLLAFQGGNKTLIIQYEHLLSSPNDVVEQMRGLLGIQAPNLDILKLGEDGRNPLAKDLNNDEVAVIREAAGDLLEQLGYEAPTKE